MDIFSASESGDATLVAKLIGEGGDPNAYRSDGVTPLILAALGNKVAAIETLLKHGANPDQPSKEGWYAYHFAKNSSQLDAAALLLKAHKGVEPVFDYAADFLRKAEPSQLAIYERLFSPEALREKLFYNLGSGNWRHPYWTNVDYASDYYHYDKSIIDVPWDISMLKPLQTKSNTVELAYCSHTTEHLTDEQNRFMFREAYRILKPGGVLRVTCPNIELYYNACMRRDPYVKQHYGVVEPMEETGSMPIWFVNEIATQLVQSFSDHKAPMADVAAIDKVLKTLPMEEACEYFTSRIDYEVQRRYPGNHINWWTNDKMCRELRAAGFPQTIVSIAGASVTAAMRDRVFFDLINPTFSLFVEAIKH